ncbi:SH3 domain-containing protein [Butyrivibrio sp. YAB3001]|uniref:SH3 domain-containing protein n=1 Tax=Butyrivibrio sp. YAB3001 TaxID=1520812 RepID=UPI0008F68A3F|nr:SH3 domain-containing protein [Butyrivibrio sp. YAB3001]SFC41632.1 Uncharacterized conserved protein YgiM, contains N-terminal SH3 domain, DUF1202 family [Butyrivibrio sp. YAB3001]
MNKLGKRVAGIMLAAGVAISVFAGTGVSAFAYTQTTGKVTSDNVKVRSSASTTASQVSSLKNGDTVDIVDEATDASGYVWYKIFVNKSEYGYVRSDLVSKSGSSDGAASQPATQTAVSLPETQASAVEQKNATVIADNANVRKGAGTAYDSVGKVSKGDTVVITGEATGTDNKNWYQVTFGANSSTGYLRGDLVEISDTPVENVENTETTEAENYDVTAENGESGETAQDQQPVIDSSTGDGAYSLVYTSDDEGNSVWYLYDNEGGYRVKVKELIEAAHSADAVSKLRKNADNYKTIAIILGLICLILVGGVVFLGIKLRESLYYEEDEEEEYDRYSQAPKKQNDNNSRRPARENENERPARRPVERPEQDERPSRRVSNDERTVRPTRRPAEEEYENRSARRQQRPSDEREDSRGYRRSDDDYESERPSRRPSREQQERPSRRGPEDRRSQNVDRDPAPKRRARNFVGEDDDFEFEFLDLDDDK